MTNYVNMEDMRGHLRSRKTSPALAHDIIMALGARYERMSANSEDENYSIRIAGMRFYDLRRALNLGSDTTVQRSLNWLILDEQIECEYWKHRDRRYFFTLHGLKTYMEKARLIEETESESLFSESDSADESPPEAPKSPPEAPKEEPATPSAGDSALALEPTFLDEKTREILEAEIARLQVIQLADKINRRQGQTLISVQNDHVMLMLSGNHAEQLEKLIKYAGLLEAE